MKKPVATAAASIMLFGGGLLVGSPVAAYPAGSDPAVAIVGSNRLAPRDLSAARAFNYEPRCSATMRITRSIKGAAIIKRTRTISSNGSTTFAYQAPARVGRYFVRVTQVKTAQCDSLTATTRFTVSR